MAVSLLSLVLAACATTPSYEPDDRPVFEGHTVESVREAARSVLEELAYGQWDVRASDWRVLTEGRIGRCDEHVDCGHGTRLEEQTLGTPWTTVEVRFEDAGTDVAVDVRIEYLTDAHCQPGWLEVECIPERLGSTGVLERTIVERMRARLEEEPAVMAIRETDMPAHVNTLVRLAHYAPPITPSTSVSAHHTPTARITAGTT